MDPRHWESVYQRKAVDEVSWYRPHLDQSLRFIDEAKLPADAAIIDVGAGASTLVQLYGVAYRLDRQPPGYLSNPLNYVSVLAFSGKTVPDSPTWYDDIQPVFAQYGNLYPIMSRYVVDLNDYASVCTRVKALHLAFSLPRRDSNHMPVTRDLGRGDRDTILKWLSTPDVDGLPRLGRPAMASTAVASASASEAAPQMPAASAPAQPDLGLLPEQGGGKTAFLLQFERRRRGAAPSGDAP